jgi:tetratricopeptide (TPR) repeat protein
LPLDSLDTIEKDVALAVETRFVAKKKHKPHHTSTPPGSLGPRIDRAVTEGRYQQALELAKQLFKQEPTPTNRELLLRIYLGRAHQLRSTGHTRDALTVLHVALGVDGSGNPEWLEQMALEFAACGDAAQAQTLLGRLPEDSAARGRVLAQAADAAFTIDDGAKHLPSEWKADYDRIVHAFSRIETGQDDSARDVLQLIGLRSPFLEWKVFLRGLLAYYQNDDTRALDNWQRLDPQRTPARLAAPYRFHLDSAFRTAQPPTTQGALQKQYEQLQGNPLPARLRELQAALSNQDEPLTRSFRLAESVLPDLRREAPHLVPHLATCLYWTIIHGGVPEDVPRYERLFGKPADDPQFLRLHALASENAGLMDEAHKQWQKYDKWVAEHPEHWPTGQVNRVRALVWCRMAVNAANLPDFEDLDLPPFLRDHPSRPKPLKPGPDECFEKSLTFAPDLLEAHEDLLTYLQDQDEPKKAEKAARVLLKQFPNHLRGVEVLAELRMEAHDYAEAIALYETATRIDPLDKDLRERLSTAHTFLARTHAEEGRFDAARTEYQVALSTFQGDRSSVYCKWAACEFKAGEMARAEELLLKALADVGSRLGVTYSMLIEVIRLKLTKLKKRFNDEFNALLVAPADAASAVAVATTASTHKVANVTYHGQKTHEKKVVAYLEKALRATFTEEQTFEICKALLFLKDRKLLFEYARLGQRSYPKNPFFPFFEVESYILMGPHRCPRWEVQRLLPRVRALAADWPAEPRKDWLLEQIKRREEMVAVVSPFGGLDFHSILDAFDPFGGEPDGDDDDDDGGW